jgi:predicted DNA-binding protein (MmcQ/YjbR family)
MDIEQLRDYCLAKPGADESFPFGPDTLVFKINGKIFLLTSLKSKPLQFNVKCDPEKAIELREQYGSVLPGYHMNKKYWNTIVIDGSIPLELLQQFIDDSYRLVSKTAKK